MISEMWLDFRSLLKWIEYDERNPKHSSRGTDAVAYNDSEEVFNRKGNEDASEWCRCTIEHSKYPRFVLIGIKFPRFKLQNTVRPPSAGAFKAGTFFEFQRIVI